jgi:phosphomannomutase
MAGLLRRQAGSFQAGCIDTRVPFAHECASGGGVSGCTGQWTLFLLSFPTRDIEEAMSKSALMVSVSGVRGVVGSSFTPDVVSRYVGGFAAFLPTRSHVLLGRDSRTSGPWVLDLAAAVLCASGHHVSTLGLCATPTLGYAIRAFGGAAGVMVTASHNSVSWNALKFLGPDGGFIRPELARRIFGNVERGRRRWVDYRRPGARLEHPEWRAEHLKQVLRLLPPVRRTGGLKVVLDTVNGAGCVLVPELLGCYGCRVHSVNESPTGLFAHPPEPLPAHLTALGREVRRRRADLGIAVDPDADRVAFVSEQGRAVGEEWSLALAVAFVLGWRPGPVVVNLSTSRVSEDLARIFHQPFYRTPVGEAHVAAKMKQVGAAIGGEGNGGVIYPALHPGRDALVGIAFVLALLRRRNASLTTLISELPAWHLAKLALPRPDDYEARLARLLAILPAGRVDRRDGLRIDWPDGWVQMRKSNTEPIVRILAEARSPQAAQKLLKLARRALSPSSRRRRWSPAH